MLRLEDTIKMHLQKVGWRVVGMDWVTVAQDKDIYDCTDERSGSIKCGEFLD